MPDGLLRLRREHDRWLVLAVVVLWAGMLVVFTVLTPIWRSPDEANHFDLVLDVADGRGYATWDSDSFLAAVLDASAPVRSAPPRIPIAPDADPPGLPPIDDVGRPSPTPNHMTQHPPAYYGLVGAGLALVRALGLTSSTVSGELALTRLLSCALLLPIPFLSWATARRLSGHLGVRRVALLAPLAVPGVGQVGSGVTNDALLILLFSGLAFVLAGYTAGRRSVGVIVAAAVLCGMALLTKAFGFAAPLWAGLVVLASWRADEARRVVRDIGLILGLSVMVGGWWYLRNLVDEGRILPSLEEGRLSAESAHAGSAEGFDEWFEIFSPVVGRGFFGLFGFADIAVSDLVYRACLLLAVAGVVAGVVAIRRSAPMLVLLVVPLPTLLVLQATQSFRLYERSGDVVLGHGRYLLPAIVPCAVLVALGVGQGGRWRARWGAPTVLVLAGFVNVHVASRLLDFFWVDGGGREALSTAIGWSPLPALMPRVVLLVIAGASLATLGLVLRAPRPESEGAAVPKPTLPTG